MKLLQLQWLCSQKSHRKKHKQLAGKGKKRLSCQVSRKYSSIWGLDTESKKGKRLEPPEQKSQCYWNTNIQQYATFIFCTNATDECVRLKFERPCFEIRPGIRLCWQGSRGHLGPSSKSRGNILNEAMTIPPTTFSINFSLINQLFDCIYFEIL